MPACRQTADPACTTLLMLVMQAASPTRRKDGSLRIATEQASDESG